MNNLTSPFDELFGHFTGKDDKWGYHCNKCGYGMETVSIQTNLGVPRKVFFCKSKKCRRFGVITVVAKKRAKSN